MKIAQLHYQANKCRLKWDIFYLPDQFRRITLGVGGDITTWAHSETVDGNENWYSFLQRLSQHG